jgi:hypothetical protein
MNKLNESNSLEHRSRRLGLVAAETAMLLYIQTFSTISLVLYRYISTFNLLLASRVTMSNADTHHERYALTGRR